MRLDQACMPPLKGNKAVGCTGEISPTPIDTAVAVKELLGELGSEVEMQCQLTSLLRCDGSALFRIGVTNTFSLSNIVRLLLLLFVTRRSFTESGGLYLNSVSIFPVSSLNINVSKKHRIIISLCCLLPSSI